MEEEKAAAYYEELSRKGGAAARFKQGLGFSSSSSRNDDVPTAGVFSTFVRASSPATSHKQSQLQSIQHKLSQKKAQSSPPRVTNRDRDRDRDRDREHWHRGRLSSGDGERRSRRRSRSRSDSDGDRDGEQWRRHRSSSRDGGRKSRRRSRSRNDSDGDRELQHSGQLSSKDRDSDRDRDKHRDKDRNRNGEHWNRRRSLSSDRERRRRRRRRSRSQSDSDSDRDMNRDRDGERRHGGRFSSRDREKRSRRRSRSRSGSDGDKRRMRDRRGEGNKGRIAGIDYAKLIDGYDKMSPAERVKAKMKFQLSETAEKDAKNGMGSGWERFEFDKDAPLDDEEMEAADDDVALVKHIGQSFRFSTVEAKREDKIKAAHDEAMFGSSRVLPSIHNEHILEPENKSKSKESAPAMSLLSDKVIAGQQGSWRDRARKA